MASDWVRGKLLGKRKHSSVYLAQRSAAPLYSSSIKDAALSRTTSFVAVKSTCEDHNITSLQLEKQTLFELRGCPEILQCFGDDFGVDEKGRQVYNLLLEYAPGGTLQHLLQYRGGKIPEYEASCFAHMLLKGLSHVHEEGYVHCNIKPSNIFVFPSADYKYGLVKHFLKIGDFRSGKWVGEESKEKHGVHKNRGMLEYSSPESVAFGEHEPPMDVWSLGCVMVQMLIGMPIWSAVTCDREVSFLGQIIANYEDNWLRSSLVAKLPEYLLSKNAKDFVWRCLRRDARKRWTVDQLLQHPFITENSKMWMPLEAKTEKIMEYPKTPFNSAFVSEFSLIC